MSPMHFLTVVQLAAIQHGPDEGPGEWWWLLRFLMFLVWITIIFLVVRWGIRGRHHQDSPMDRARGILAERYARGEIDAEAYRQRSETLR